MFEFDGNWWHILAVACISGSISSFFMVFVTYLASKLEYIPAGVLGSIPVAIVPASISWLILHPQDLSMKALYVVPCGIVMDCLFLFLWRTVPRKFARWSYHCFRRAPVGLIISLTLILSLIAWIGVAIGLIFLLELVDDQILYAALICSGFTVAFGMFMTARQQLPPSQNQLSVAHPLIYLVVGTLSSIFISSSILISGVNVIAAGILASFPDFFMICAVSHWWYEGLQVKENRPITASLYIANMILGTLSISAYCIVFGLLWEAEFSKWYGDFAMAIIMCASTSFAIAFFFFAIPVIVILRVIQLVAEKQISPIVIGTQQSPWPKGATGGQIGNAVHHSEPSERFQQRLLQQEQDPALLSFRDSLFSLDPQVYGSRPQTPAPPSAASQGNPKVMMNYGTSISGSTPSQQQQQQPQQQGQAHHHSGNSNNSTTHLYNPGGSGHYSSGNLGGTRNATLLTPSSSDDDSFRAAKSNTGTVRRTNEKGAPNHLRRNSSDDEWSN